MGMYRPADTSEILFGTAPCALLLLLLPFRLNSFHHIHYVFELCRPSYRLDTSIKRKGILELSPCIIQFLTLYVQFVNVGIAALGTISLIPE